MQFFFFFNSTGNSIPLVYIIPSHLEYEMANNMARERGDKGVLQADCWRPGSSVQAGEVFQLIKDE